MRGLGKTSGKGGWHTIHPDHGRHKLKPWDGHSVHLWPAPASCRGRDRDMLSRLSLISGLEGLTFPAHNPRGRLGVGRAEQGQRESDSPGGEAAGIGGAESSLGETLGSPTF